MVVRRQYADKGVGIQKRPPPPPKINVNNLIVDDKVKLSEKQKNSKKESGKKSKSSPQLLGVPRCEASREVLQSREPESSHRRSSRAHSRSRSRGRSRSERHSSLPPRQRSLPQPPPPKEYAIAPSSMKRTKSLTKTAKPSTNSKPKLFGANEAKKKSAAATTKTKKAAKAQQQARHARPKWNQVLYGSKSSCNKSLASTNTRQKKAAVAGQINTRPAPSNTVPAQKKKVVRINAPPGSVRTCNTRSIQTKPGLDDKIIMALDNCLGDFDLYDCLEDTGERVETMQQYLKDGDESTMPGKAKLLYQKSTETYQGSQKQIGERFERSMKAMADADEGRRTEPELEPEPEPELEDEETIDDNEEIVQKDRNMDFSVEVTTDTTQTNSNSLDALLKKSEAEEVPATKDENTAAESSTEATKKKEVDLTPIKKQIKNEVKQAKKSASLRLGLYLQGLAKNLIGEEAADNLCCSALDSTGLEEEDLSKSTIEKELEERKKRADIVSIATNAQQQQDVSDTTQAVVPNGNVDERTENVQEAIDATGNKVVRTKTLQDAILDQTATSIADADNSVLAENDKDKSDDKYLYPPFQSTFPIDQKVSDILESKVTEEENSEEVIETSTQRIEGKLRELVQLLGERNVKKVVDVAAVIDEPKETSKTEEVKEESTSIIEEKEFDCEMDKSISKDSRLSF